MGILQIYDTGFGLKLVDPETSETGGSTGAVTLDLTSSRNFDITAAGAITYTFANPPSGRRLTTTFKLVLVNGGTGTQTWPASVTWLSGSVPTLKTSGTNILQFTTTNGGTTWLGSDITPATSLAITPTSLTSTGFTLDPSLTTEISFWCWRTAAPTGVPRFQYSNNGGTTWVNLIAAAAALPTDGLTTLNLGFSTQPYVYYANMSFAYISTFWHLTSVWRAPEQGGNTGRNKDYTYRSITFTPTASTIYRYDMNQTGWSFTQPVVTQG